MKWTMMLLLTLVLGACVVHAHGHHHGRVVVAHNHWCNSTCDHYHYRGHWYVVRNHHHGPGCGHVFVSGRWVIH